MGNKKHVKVINGNINMGYRYKPSASQRKEFAERMKDPEEQKVYEDRKRAKSTYSDNPLSFKHKSFVPTQMQNDHSWKMLSIEGLKEEQYEAARQVLSAFSCQDKVHHDYIHIVNAHQREQS